jgi:hypothetical protein
MSHEHNLAEVDHPTRLYGGRLAIARAAWVVLALLALGLFATALPVHIAGLLRVAGDRPLPGQLSPADLQALGRLGLSLGFYAAYDVLWTLLLAASCTLLALFIFRRRSDDWMALLVAFTLLALGLIAPPAIGALADAHPLWRIPVVLLQSLALAGLLAIFYLFPDGRFVPSWARWPACGWAVYLLLRLLTPGSAGQIYVSQASSWRDLLVLMWFLGWLISGVVAQLYRYRRVSNPIQRQQTKWVVFGFTAMCLGLIGIGWPLLIFPAIREPGLARLLYGLALQPLATCVMLLFPISTALALLRSRLFEIDILINRTLVYGLLSALLALIYVGSVVLLQQIFRAITGQGSDFAVVASTLGILALFAPLRQKLQTMIDRRFYRRKYDAARTLAAFNATLRDEVDLQGLTGRLLAVVDETMQPAHVSLSLRAPEQEPPARHFEIRD